MKAASLSTCHDARARCIIIAQCYDPHNTMFITVTVMVVKKPGPGQQEDYLSSL